MNVKEEITNKLTEEKESKIECKGEEQKLTDAPFIKVCQILPNMRVSAKVRVCDRTKIKYLNKKMSAKLRVRNFLVGDSSGVIPYTAFNEEINELGEIMGEVNEIKNAWAKFYKSTLQVSKGKSGSLQTVQDTNFPTKEQLLEHYNKTQLETASDLASGAVYYSEIVGIKYQVGGRNIYQKPVMTELELRPEPENVYDDKAVSVWLNDRKVGYIPKKQNKAVFKALMEKIPLKSFLGIYVPRYELKYCIPQNVKNVPITISTILQEIEWRPVILYPEDLIAL